MSYAKRPHGKADVPTRRARRRSWFRRPLIQIATLTVLLGAGPLAASLAQARPGGGHSYSGGGGGFSGGGRSYSGGGGFSGGGRSYSGGGGYSGGGSCGSVELLGAILVLAFLSVSSFLTQRREEWESSEGSFQPISFDPPRAPVIPWDQLRRLDPDFSRVVFEDFAYRLYASAHEARNDPEAMAALAPYLSADVRQALSSREPRDRRISNVVIGSMTVVDLVVPPSGQGRAQIDLRFESNVTAEHEQTDYVIETWQLVRDASVRSRAPEAVRALKCPNCGAPFQAADDQRCKYCGEVVSDGRFDWFVVGTRLAHTRMMPPAVGGYAPEAGTHAPTRFDPKLEEGWLSLLRDDPALTQPGFIDRVRTVYERLNPAWVARKLGYVRGFLSEGMQDYLQYWLDAYYRQDRVNVLDDMQLRQVELVKVTRDRYYDAITVRIFATGIDYTIRDSDGRLIGGSKTMPRRYSEYWTFIRGSGVRGPARADANCPNCGAPLQINMAGSCEHCGAHLTRGEFDWVLSRIEQDESYRG